MSRVAVVVVAVCALVVVLQYAAAVLLPVVLAIFLFYALDPVVDWCQRRRMPRSVAAVLAVTALTAGIAAAGFALWPQVDAVLMEIPEGAQRLRSTVRDLRSSKTDSPIGRVQQAAKAIDSAAAAASDPPLPVAGVTRVEVAQPFRISEWLWSGGVSAIALVGQTLSVFLLAIFLLVEKDLFRKRIVARLPTQAGKRAAVEIFDRIEEQVGRFIWVQVLTSSAVAAITGVSLALLGVNQPIVWGIFAGVMNVVPYYGPVIVSTVLTAVAFLQFGAIWESILVGGVALAITTAEGMLLTPHLLSRAGSINHVAIFLAIGFWSWTWGVAGMFLAVPMLMVARVVCDSVEPLRGVGEFLAE